MNKYFTRLLQKFQPHGEPMRYILKVKGNMKYFYALMNNETCFWIAQQLADTKNPADVTPLFNKGKDVAGTRPSMLISDESPKFVKSFECRSISMTR